MQYRFAERGPAVNIILFSSTAQRQTLARTDPRARHLLEVLACSPGDDFRAGVIDGPTGTGSLLAVEEERLELAFRWHGTAPPLDDITLIVGLPRPPSARKILYQAAALGCREIRFVHTASSDPNYARSRLWTTREWRRHLVDGLQQSVATALPAVSCGIPLRSALQQLPAEAAAVVLDNAAGARASRCLRAAPAAGAGPGAGAGLDRRRPRSAAAPSLRSRVHWASGCCAWRRRAWPRWRSRSPSWVGCKGVPSQWPSH